MKVFFYVNADLILAVFRILCRSVKVDQVNVFVLAALVSSCDQYDSVLWFTDYYRPLCDQDYICLCPVITTQSRRKPLQLKCSLLPCSFRCVISLQLFPLNRLPSLSPYRLSIPNMEDLKRHILKVVSNCNKPKVKKQTNKFKAGKSVHFTS